MLDLSYAFMVLAVLCGVTVLGALAASDLFGWNDDVVDRRVGYLILTALALIVCAILSGAVYFFLA